MFVINTIGKLNILTIIWFQYVINSIPTRQESLLRLHCRRWPQWCWSKWSFGGSDSHTYVLGWLEVSEEHIKHIILCIIYVNLNKLYIYIYIYISCLYCTFFNKHSRVSQLHTYMCIAHYFNFMVKLSITCHDVVKHSVYIYIYTCVCVLNVSSLQILTMRQSRHCQLPVLVMKQWSHVWGTKLHRSMHTSQAMTRTRHLQHTHRQVQQQTLTNWLGNPSQLRAWNPFSKASPRNNLVKRPWITCQQQEREPCQP